MVVPIFYRLFNLCSWAKVEMVSFCRKYGPLQFLSACLFSILKRYKEYSQIIIDLYSRLWVLPKNILQFSLVCPEFCSKWIHVKLCAHWNGLVMVMNKTKQIDHFLCVSACKRACASIHYIIMKALQ